MRTAKDLRVPGQGLTRAGEEEPTWNSRPGVSGPERPWRRRTCTALALPHAVPTAPRRPPPPTSPARLTLFIAENPLLAPGSNTLVAMET